MPSAKTGSKKDKKGVESESPWKFDCWLPRAIALKEDYPKNHAWWTVLSEYGNSDSTVTLPLYKIQKQLLEEKGLWKIYEEKLKLLSIITDMEERGVTASQKRCRELGKRYKDESAQAGRLCVNIAKSYDYDLTLPKSGNNGSLVKFCFGPLGLESLKKSKKTGEPSLDKEVLEQYEITLSTRSKPFHFVRAIRGKRKRDTAIGFINSYADKFGIPFLDDPDWMTLYPGLNDTGTGTLRGASSNPNGQQISKKEDFNLRYCFGPAPGREWYSCDYENIELRIPAYESGERVMIELFEKPDEPPYFGSYHLMNASIVYPDIFWPLAEKKGEFKKKYASTWYQYIKNFGFAVGYGAMLGSGTADRAAHYAEYLILYPNRRGSGGAQEQVVSRLKEHSKLNKKYIDFAEKHNYVETLPDKTVDPTRGYPIMCSRSPWGKISPTIPLNYHVQSTAMWCTTKSMIRCAEYLKSYPSHFMTLQVHDEIVFDFPQGDKRNGRIIMMVKSMMEQSGEDIGIPLTVAVNRHSNNWSESDSDWSVAT
jgi:DNA polymerase I-like protein with 3'-5' exonuclease and polymerase domains